MRLTNLFEWEYQRYPGMGNSRQYRSLLVDCRRSSKGQCREHPCPTLACLHVIIRYIIYSSWNCLPWMWLWICFPVFTCMTTGFIYQKGPKDLKIIWFVLVQLEPILSNLRLLKHGPRWWLSWSGVHDLLKLGVVEVRKFKFVLSLLGEMTRLKTLSDFDQGSVFRIRLPQVSHPEIQEMILISNNSSLTLVFLTERMYDCRKYCIVQYVT